MATDGPYQTGGHPAGRSLGWRDIALDVRPVPAQNLSAHKALRGCRHMHTRDFFINAVRMISLDGSTNLPTALAYSPSGDLLFGASALNAPRNNFDVHLDFKVEVGTIEPGTLLPRDNAHPLRLANDFLHEVLKQTRDWLALNDLDQGTSVLLAEPLAMQTGLVGADWLTNYRNNLKRILAGRGFTDIDFLPEPFAVFQYYRYGIRHPAVAEGGKKQALVIDVGGGTCDICVIETTRVRRH